ncbi:hypothetical protein AYK26_05495 [Euryarchaeota archaeon SM23-78]|nr:MAG: hypothetical protein AYK26_05495 [Euryarchaeota archaeon SM23-78]
MVHMFRAPHLELVCPLCKTQHNGNNGNGGWKPEFWKHDHYKTLLCDCGYKIFLKTEVLNSGHY